MRRFLMNSIGFLSLTNLCQAEESIFPDKKLEAAVRHEVFIKRGTDKPIVAADVKRISVIHANRKGIKNLQGLEHCAALRRDSIGSQRCRGPYAVEKTEEPRRAKRPSPDSKRSACALKTEPLP
ncbi:MAG: hypothetical protein QGG53_35585 [Planctomycetota bacterium]|nr:hypothetical protein [Planctomycetota bacterium]